MRCCCHRAEGDSDGCPQRSFSCLLNGEDGWEIERPRQHTIQRCLLLQTEKFYDFSGSCTYAYLVLYTLRKHAGVSFPPKRITRPLINSSLVLIWAARLGSFLLSRILEDGRDSRFDKVRNNPPKFLFYWAIQALWIFLVPTRAQR